MADVPATELVSAPQDQDAQAASDSQATAAASILEDFRVRCTMKKAVVEVMEMCSRFLQKLGAVLPEDIRELALRDAQWVRWSPLPRPSPHSAWLWLWAPVRPRQMERCPQTGLGNAREGYHMRVPPGCFLFWDIQGEHVCNLKRQAVLVYPYS